MLDWGHTTAGHRELCGVRQHSGCESFCVEMVLKRRVHTHSTYCTILGRAFPSIMCWPCWQHTASDSIAPRMSNVFLHHQGRRANIATNVAIKCVCYASRRLGRVVAAGVRQPPPGTVNATVCLARHIRFWLARAVLSRVRLRGPRICSPLAAKPKQR